MLTQCRIGIESILPNEGWRFNQAGIDVLSHLFQQLSPYKQPLTIGDFLAMVHQGECFLAVDLLSQNGHIVGMARLVTQGRNPRYGVIHDVVVDEEYRKQGIGTLLMNRAIALARTSKFTHVELRSKRARTAIGHLCQSLGFTLVAAADPEDPGSTNHYRLTLSK